MSLPADADRTPDQPLVLDALAGFTERLNPAADLPEQLSLTADVLRRVLGEVSVAFLTREASGQWQPAAGAGTGQNAATPPVPRNHSVDQQALKQLFVGHVPVFVDPVTRRTSAGTPGAALYGYLQGGQPCGVLSVTLPEGHGWNDTTRAAFRSVGSALGLALNHCAAQTHSETLTRRLEDRAAALTVFAAFTERAATETDVLALSRAAYEVMDANFGQYSGAYYQVQDGLWKALTWTAELTPAQIAMIRRGLPLDVPSFAQALKTREPVFIDGWDAEREQIEDTDVFGPVCIYPLVTGPQVRGIFTVGLRAGEQWQARDQGLMRALGRSLTLALERGESVELQAQQNAELQARTRALEAFEVLSRELTLDADPFLLVRRAQEIALSLLPTGFAVYYEPEGRLFRARAQVGSVGNEALQQAIDAGLPTGSTHSLRRPYESGRPSFQDRYDTDTDQLADLTRHMGAAAVLPIMNGGQVRGLLALGLEQRRSWTATDRALLETMTRSLGLALERAESVRQLARSNAELQVAVRELEAFAYSVSHDLRTPVRHIKGFNALLRTRLGDLSDLKTSHYLSVIDDAAGRMNVLIDAMLDLSRTTMRPLQMEAVDLAALVTSVLTELSAEFTARTPDWQVGALPVITGDHHLLRQVVVNLLSNALKYSSPREQAVIEIWAEDGPDSWTVLVRDNGVGFDPRYADRLFGVFQRLHHEREFEGTGVGLANVRRIVARHSGQVAAQTPGIGRGATFSFTLPRDR